jgi:hypothetical protein
LPGVGYPRQRPEQARERGEGEESAGQTELEPPLQRRVVRMERQRLGSIVDRHLGV